MGKPVNCILLIDDNQDDNFYHSKVIENVGLVEYIRIAKNGLEGLAYLKNEGVFANKEVYPRPNIIFLDINMPKMNGFEFLDQYNKLHIRLKAEVCVFMLTTSISHEDKEKSLKATIVKKHLNKPLKKEALEELIGQYKRLVYR